MYEQKVYGTLDGKHQKWRFYDEKKKGTLLSSGSPALCKSAALRLQHGGRTGYQVGFYFNTVISVSIYEKGSEELLDDCFALAQKYEGYFSNTIPDSDISKINDAGGAPVTVHDETIELLKTGIAYGDLSGGKFDITIGRLFRSVGHLNQSAA